MDGNKSVKIYKEALRQAMLNLVWRQWSALGIMGHQTPVLDIGAVDPESLLVASSVFCRYDQRLYDLILSWLIKYGELVSPNRIRAFLKLVPQLDCSSLGYIAEHCAGHGDSRWRNLAREFAKTEHNLQALFFDAEEKPVTYCRETDKLAGKCGFIRNRFIPQNKQFRKLPDSKSCLYLHVRGLFGVSAKAEVILQLMSRPCNINELVKYSGYARSSIKDELIELELGDAVTTVGRGARNVTYALKYSAQLCQMLKAENCMPIYWVGVYASMLLLWQHLSWLYQADISDATINGELALLFRESLQPLLVKCGISALENVNEANPLEIANALDSI